MPKNLGDAGRVCERISERIALGPPSCEVEVAGGSSLQVL